MKPTIKLRFVDMPTEFHTRENYMTRMLEKRYNLSFDEKPDFVFYSVFGYEHFHYPDAVKIFLCGEPVVPNFNDCDYAIGYVKLDFGQRYHRASFVFASSTGDPIPLDIQNRSGITTELANRRFCNFIYSNDSNGEGALLRIAFCKKLSQYRHVDCPGMVLHNMNAPIAQRYEKDAQGNYGVFGTAWQQGKRNFQARYKFSIAFESTLLSGMTSDKIIDPLLARSVPIYWGNPDILDEVNPRAFINCHDYGDDLEAVVRRVKELDQDQDAYMAMLREKPLVDNYPFDEKERLEAFVFSIIERGNVPVRSRSAVYTFPPISAYSLSRCAPYFDSEETIKALRDYESDTHKLVKRLQRFGHSRAGYIPRVCFKTGIRLYRKWKNRFERSNDHE